MVNPKDSGLIMTGDAFIQQSFRSLLGSSTVTKRIPVEEDCKELSTTDATVTTILSVPVPLSSIRHVVVSVHCIQDDATEGGRHARSCIRRRGSSGNVAEVAAETFFHFSEDSTGTPMISATVDTTNQAWSYSGYRRCGHESLLDL